MIFPFVPSFNDNDLMSAIKTHGLRPKGPSHQGKPKGRRAKSQKGRSNSRKLSTRAKRRRKLSTRAKRRRKQ